MADDTEHLFSPSPSFDCIQTLDTSTVPTESFPTSSDGIPWNDWTFGLGPTTDWNHQGELQTQPDDIADHALFDDLDFAGLPSLPAEHEDSGAIDYTPDAEPTGLEAEDSAWGDFTNVSLWLDGAYRPPVPCSHCKHNRLQCLIIQTTPANPNPVTSCSSCVALFRECSLARGEKRQPAGFETVTPVLGHLHGVTELAEERPGISIHAQDNFKDNSPSIQNNNGPHKKQFSRKGAKVLRGWFYQHQQWPYPSHKEKTELARETGFTAKQVSDWFTNARRRQKQTFQSSKPAQVFRSGSPMPTSTLPSMTPMERWRHSPPEDEHVSASVIQDAIASAPIDTTHSSWNTSNEGDDMFQNSADEFTSISSMGSRNSYASSDSAAWSHHSGESLPFPLLTSKSSNRPRKKRAHRRSAQKERRYQCTFCTDKFATKYDWSRHEKSVHISLESWICTPNLAENWHTDNQQSACRFCGLSSAPAPHIEVHEFDICATRPPSERTFNRKDHLWQHLRKFHQCTKMPSVEVCRSESNNVRSRCGFCGLSLQTWSARADHLAGHFKGGSRMDQWIGDWGLDSSVLAVLRDAVLPSDRAESESLGVT